MSDDAPTKRSSSGGRRSGKSAAAVSRAWPSSRTSDPKSGGPTAISSGASGAASCAAIGSCSATVTPGISPRRILPAASSGRREPPEAVSHQSQLMYRIASTSSGGSAARDHSSSVGRPAKSPWRLSQPRWRSRSSARYASAPGSCSTAASLASSSRKAWSRAPHRGDSSAARPLELRPQQELRVDRYRTAVADEDPRRDRREPVPRREEPARLVERGGDEPAVDEAGPALVPLVEADVGLVLFGALDLRHGQREPERIVAAAPARRVVMRRDPVHQTFSNVPMRSSGP